MDKFSKDINKALLNYFIAKGYSKAEIELVTNNTYWDSYLLEGPLSWVVEEIKEIHEVRQNRR